MHAPHRLGLLALAIIAAASPLAAQPKPQTSRPSSAGAPSVDELEMPARSASFRRVADEFVAAAAAGEAAKAHGMISPNLAERAGAEVVQQNLSGQVLPFFAQLREIGRSVTITQTTDAFGSTGFAFYMYLVPKSGEPRPFVIYIVEEKGKSVVANILVDHFVEGRHK
jgi:hypothetical protein